MSVTTPAFNIARYSVVGEENEWVKMFDPPTESPETPELLSPTNPVPEVMAAAGFQIVSVPHTVQRALLKGLDIPTWDGLKILKFFTIGDSENPTLVNGTYPGPITRVPRGVIFHGMTHGQGPPPHTIHWHGIEPTPINDGVGHCSMEIGSYLYQWQPNFIGTYFYHCHRNTVQHFEFGLFSMLLIEAPDAYFSTLWNPAIPIGAGRDGKRRTAANLKEVVVGGTITNHGTVMGGTIADLSASFPGWKGGKLTDPDPEANNPALPDFLKFQTDPHAMTVPYDVEVLWGPDDRDSTWSDLAPDARATFPKHGNNPGVDDRFHENLGGSNFFAFNDFNADYWFITGVPVPAHKGGTGTIPADAVVPPALNSGAKSQVAINAQVGQTIFVRCLDCAYNTLTVTFPVDVVIIEWDGRALGMTPYGQYNKAYQLLAGTPIHMSVARRFGALIRANAPISDFAKLEFIDTRGSVPGEPPIVLMTARIPINIGVSAGFTISGRVTSRGAAPLAGVTMTLTPGNKTTTTDGAGNYNFSGLADGTYTVVPSLAGFPSRRSVIINGADATGRDFRAR